jgi:hypothetical protein
MVSFNVAGIGAAFAEHDFFVSNEVWAQEEQYHLSNGWFQS